MRLKQDSPETPQLDYTKRVSHLPASFRPQCHGTIRESQTWAIEASLSDKNPEINKYVNKNKTGTEKTGRWT